MVDVQGRREDRRRASIFSVTLQRSSWVLLVVHGSSAKGASGGDGRGCGGLGGRKGGGGLGDGCGGAGVGGGTGDSRVARSTGNHCGGHASGGVISTSLIAALGGFGRNAAQKAAATPMRTSVREPGAAFSAYKGRARSRELGENERACTRGS